MARVQTPSVARQLTRPMHWSLATLFRTRSRDAWVELFADADACATPVLTLQEALNNEQVTQRGMVENIDGQAMLGCPLRFDGGKREPLSPAPELGADNDRVKTKN